MATVHEPARDVPVVHETDVLVVGGGPGGPGRCPGRGARRGRRRRCWSAFGCFGGNITAVGVEGWPGTATRRPSRPTASAASSRTRAQAMGAAMPEQPVAVATSSMRRASRWSPTCWCRRPASRRCCTAPFVGAVSMDGDRSRGVITESQGRARGDPGAGVSSTPPATPTSRIAPARRRARRRARRCMAASVMFHRRRRRQAAPSSTAVQGRPADLQGLGRRGEWNIETDRQGGRRCSRPSCASRSSTRSRTALLPRQPDDARRHLGRGARQRRADVHEPRPPRRLRRHRPRRPHPRRDRGPPPGDARRRGAAPLHARLRGRAAAQLRHDHRHPRHPQDRRRVQPDRAPTCAARAASRTRSGSTPSSSTATAS